MNKAIAALLGCVHEEPAPQVLWSMQYQQMKSQEPLGNLAHQDGVMILPSLSQDLALEDEVMSAVKSAWRQITGDPEEAFMVFEARDGMEDEDE